MKKIIIALESNFTNKIFENSFLEENFEVATTTRGEKALEIINQSAPDVIIADTNLHDINAFELLEILKKNENTKRIPFIVYSRTGSVEHREKAMDHEAKDFVIGLSDSPRDVVSKIKSHLGEEAVYVFEIDEKNKNTGLRIARDIGYEGGTKCPKCSSDLSLYLLRNLALGKNTFKISLVCSKCAFRHGSQ
jgi:PleD family two-component response regulator